VNVIKVVRSKADKAVRPKVVRSKAVKAVSPRGAIKIVSEIAELLGVNKDKNHFAGQVIWALIEIGAIRQSRPLNRDERQQFRALRKKVKAVSDFLKMPAHLCRPNYELEHPFLSPNEVLSAVSDFLKMPAHLRQQIKERDHQRDHPFISPKEHLSRALERCMLHCDEKLDASTETPKARNSREHRRQHTSPSA
jgi:hypothetical protein